ncbi:5'(3')-deoxyribonucleotidase, mitochondrial isoform X2 [Rhinolophus ferrumequinum]|uniref:5'(3')-deoxyribonucleotidase, mitochondrial isoform X2 n=1 Tax=Rhinolophus ferrumequinum TaxID=59479 RepID=UPI00140F8BA3|nr:5'(3')-deoxyribonucleotidase, mitochondrial isoform X2 [Rhinolophus ferrumequinum]
MIRLRGWCAPRPRGSAVPGARRWAAGGPAGAMGGRALRVLVDMDGVLADFEGGFLKKFRARFPDQPFIALEDRRGFWLSEQYGRLQPGLSEKAISIWESENFFFDLEPLPGAVEAVKQMASLENTAVFICTSPIKKYKYCPYEKYAWVEKHFGPDFLEQVVLTRDKTVVSADLLIDDRPDITAREEAAAGGVRPAITRRPVPGPSPTPAGNTSSSQPATIGTYSCSPPAAGCTPGRTTGRPFWTASGPAELDCALGSSAGPLTSGLPAPGPGGLVLWPEVFLSGTPGPLRVFSLSPALPGLKVTSGQDWPWALDWARAARQWRLPSGLGSSRTGGAGAWSSPQGRPLPRLAAHPGGGGSKMAEVLPVLRG